MWSLLVPFLSAIFFISGFIMSSEATAQVQATISVPATGQWVDTHVNVTDRDALEVNAGGTWSDGNATSGPEGAGKWWPDNFLNLGDLGVCNTCARTITGGWGALIGYIGNAPPAPGSYTNKAVLAEASKIFYIGSSFQQPVPLSGRLWLNKNADAYSGYTVDNRGSITASIKTYSRTEPDNWWRFTAPVVCLSDIGRGVVTPPGWPVGAGIAMLNSPACIGTFVSGTVQGIALIQCLRTYNGSVDTCVLSGG